VAILAELVALRAAPGGAGSPGISLPEQAVDPVCGMSVDVATARFTSRYGDEVVYFCAAGCQRAYEAMRAAGGGDHEDQP
jgi:YHS domain-containing protein